jgi:translation initiation factor IF-2
MSDLATNTPRLMAAAKEFNIGSNTLIDFLVTKGYNSDDLKPTAKLTEPMYTALQAEFQTDKAAKQKAEKVELIKATPPADNKKKRDEEDLSFKKKETPAPASPAPVKEEPPVAAPTAVAAPIIEAVAPAPAPVIEPIKVQETPTVSNTTSTDNNGGITKIDAPELEAPKVIAKINLDEIDSSTRPKKSTKKVDAKGTPPAAAPAPVPAPAPVVNIAPTAPAPTPIKEEPKVDAPATIENIKADRIEGPKILGKIVLPVDNDTRPKREAEDKRKRKRIPVERKGGTPLPPNQQQGGGQQQRPGGGFDPNRNNRPRWR